MLLSPAPSFMHCALSPLSYSRSSQSLSHHIYLFSSRSFLLIYKYTMMTSIFKIILSLDSTSPSLEIVPFYSLYTVSNFFPFILSWAFLSLHSSKAVLTEVIIDLHVAHSRSQFSVLTLLELLIQKWSLSPPWKTWYLAPRKPFSLLLSHFALLPHWFLLLNKLGCILLIILTSGPWSTLRAQSSKYMYFLGDLNLPPPLPTSWHMSSEASALAVPTAWNTTLPDGCVTHSHFIQGPTPISCYQRGSSSSITKLKTASSFSVTLSICPTFIFFLSTYYPTWHASIYLLAVLSFSSRM